MILTVRFWKTCYLGLRNCRKEYEKSNTDRRLTVLNIIRYSLFGVYFKAVLQRWINEFKTSSRFRKVFILVFYIAMILFRTLLNRDMWRNPVSNVIGVWGLYNENGELTTEAIENLALFIPFTVLLLWSFHEKFLGEGAKLLRTIWQSIKIVFLFSLTIEFLQLFLRLGTFQLSDLFYNTLGGLVGGLIYWIGYKLTHRDRK